MATSTAPAEPGGSSQGHPFLALLGDTFALVLLAVPVVVAPLSYPYHYYHRLWYVTSEATGLAAGSLAILWAIAEWLLNRGRGVVPSKNGRTLAALVLGYGAYVAWVLYENSRGVWADKAWSEWFFIVASALLAYAVYRVSGREGLGLPALAAVLAGPVAVSFVGIDQYFALHDWATREVTRVWSTTGNSNTLSGYLAPALPLAIATAYALGGRRRYLWWLVSLVIATGILLSYTRGGWYAVAAAVVVLAVMLDRKIVLALLAYLLIASAIFPGVLTRATSALSPEESVSFQQRLQLWWTAWYMWVDHPLAGVGTGSYSTLIPEYVAKHPDIDRGLRDREPHNTYLKTLAEQGLVGFVLVFGTLLLGWWATFREWRQSRAGPRKALLAGVVAAIFAVALHSVTNSVLHDFRSALEFWAVGGLGLRLLVMPEGWVNL